MANEINFIQIEATLHRVVTAIKPLIDTETKKHLEQLEYAIAELRHMQVVTQLHKTISLEEAADRLIAALFKV